MGAFSSKSSTGNSNSTSSSSSSSTKAHASSSAITSVTAVDRTVLDLKNARDRLQRYRVQLQTDDDRLRHQAIAAKQAGHEATALGLLRLRRFQQQQATACEAQLLNVLQMVQTIGSTQNDAKLLDAMRAGKEALHQLHQTHTVEDVLNLYEQIQEQHDTQQEIDAVLQTVPILSDYDEQAMLDELMALQDQPDPASVTVPPIPTTTTATTEFPAVPTDKLPDPIAAVTSVSEQLPTPTTPSSARIAVLG